ncbi:MAG: DUF3267 domain-containing protein [Clostridia bacterium]|nr:DUF3267 domain-containing protein [Clostridia bacterium]
MKNEKSFERELPTGYKEALYINAKNLGFGLIFNLIALLVLAGVMALAFLSLGWGEKTLELEADPIGMMIASVVFIAAMIGYIILHELVHGLAYKALTGERLTFGLSWSCAFCGVPDVYTYRRTAIIAVTAPLVSFTVLFIPLLIALYFLSPLYYLLTAFLFGLHLGGCSGDIYVFLLLMTKFKSKSTLMRDTGPEQFFYLPEE